jgi:hypothetical protein
MKWIFFLKPPSRYRCRCWGKRCGGGGGGGDGKGGSFTAAVGCFFLFFYLSDFSFVIFLVLVLARKIISCSEIEALRESEAEFATAVGGHCWI